MIHLLKPNDFFPAPHGIKRIHFVGIGGSGMGALAEVLLRQGYQISGSDLSSNRLTQQLEKLGAQIVRGHEAASVAGSDLVVSSSAVTADNPELQAAKAAQIPIISRGRMLAELMRFRHGVAVAGAHGKTTTTSLIASLFLQEGLDPTCVIGGLLNSIGSHARLGAGLHLIAEADESDGSFLFLSPLAAVVTNVDADHLNTYGNDFERLKDAYLQFMHNLPFYGLAVLCSECPHLRSLFPKIERRYVTYGFDPSCDYQALEVRQEGLITSFIVRRRDHSVLPITLNLGGDHNVLNALGALSLASEYGVSDLAIQHALKQFQGVGRRMQLLGTLTVAGHQIPLIDDYGHHPAEIDAMYQAVRGAWPKHRLVVVFEPHRYSRTAALFEEFCQSLSQAEVLLLMEVYPMGEKPILKADSRHLMARIQQIGKVEPVLVTAPEQLEVLLSEHLRPGDVLLMQGAGTIGAHAARLARQGLA